MSHERKEGPSTQQLIDLQNRLSRLADEGAVGLLSKTDVALVSWSLGYATAGVDQDGRARREWLARMLVDFIEQVEPRRALHGDHGDGCPTCQLSGYQVGRLVGTLEGAAGAALGQDVDLLASLRGVLR